MLKSAIDCFEQAPSCEFSALVSAASMTAARLNLRRQHCVRRLVHPYGHGQRFRLLLMTVDGLPPSRLFCPSCSGARVMAAQPGLKTAARHGSTGGLRPYNSFSYASSAEHLLPISPKWQASSSSDRRSDAGLEDFQREVCAGTSCLPAGERFLELSLAALISKPEVRRCYSPMIVLTSGGPLALNSVAQETLLL